MNMWKLRNFFYRLFRPSFWIQNERTCWEWDKILHQALLDNPDITIVDSYTALINNGVEVWVSNFPYSYGGAYTGMGSNGPLPSPITRVMLSREISRAKAKDIASKRSNVAPLKSVK